MRPALHYHGAKWRVAEKILPHFPGHSIYLEPFFGGGGLFLQKPRAAIESINDKYGEVVNFFEVLRDHPEELARAISLTPWADDERKKHPGEASHPVEKARRFWLRCWASIGSEAGRPSFRISKTPNAQPAAVNIDVAFLEAHAKRLIGVQIENMDAIDFLDKYLLDRPDCLAYVDPPYLPQTRSQSHRKSYKYEIDHNYHRRLAELLNDTRASVVISGYPSDLYDKWFDGWESVAIESQTRSGRMAMEVIWISPWTPKQRQISLFDSRFPPTSSCDVL